MHTSHLVQTLDPREFCKDHLEDASLHAKSLRLAMEAS